MDGDGIPNNQDHCPRSPGGKYDEDGDGLGDECDPCPIAPPPSTPDADGDAVDSPCDPDSHTAGDVISVFFGFGEQFPSTWTPSDPSAFAVDNGDLVVTPSGTDPVTLSIPIPASSTNLAVVAGYKITGLIDTDFHRIAVTGADPRPAGGELVKCGPERSKLVDVIQVDSTAGSANMPAMLDVFDTAASYKATFRQQGATIDCVVLNASQSGVVSTTGTGDFLSFAGLEVQGATVRFSYIMVVTRLAGGSGVR